MTPSIVIPSYDLLVVDGSYLIHRILYASGAKGDPPFSEMYNSNGDPTGAIYGCLKTIRSIVNLDEFIANDVAVVWDGRPRGLSQRRVAMYPGYKVHEEHKDPTAAAESAIHRNLLETQRPFLGNILNLLGVPSVNLPYREGDDVIGCFVRQIPDTVKVLVVSDDKDYYQLVRPSVHVYRAGIKTPVIVHDQNFEQIVGVKTPLQYLLRAAITGDGSDSIDGIDGVGDTSAQRLANETVFNGPWATFTAIKEAADRLIVSDSRNRKRYTAIMDNIGVVVRNLQLMDLRLESLSSEESNQLRCEFTRDRGVQEMAVVREFDRLEFRSYLNDLSGWLQPFRRLLRNNNVM